MIIEYLFKFSVAFGGLGGGVKWGEGTWRDRGLYTQSKEHM